MLAKEVMEVCVNVNEEEEITPFYNFEGVTMSKFKVGWNNNEG